MLKLFNCNKTVYRVVCKTVVEKRSFLSEAYRCEEAWKARLKNPLLRDIKPQTLFLTLDQQVTTQGKLNALDVDIFANSVTEKYQSEEMLYLLHHLRLSAEATNILDSTHHAVIRHLLDHDCTEELITVLHDRLNYGIFPDHVSYNILMDTYLKRKDYASAAKIGVLPMLQEDRENLITNALSVYCCHKYLENPDVWQKPSEPKEDDSEEETKVRVKYLINPYFDDHFDLKEPRDLVGKTLAFHGKAMKNTLGRTLRLRGLILYKKYHDALMLIKQWQTENEDVVYKEVFNLIEKDNAHIPKEEIPNELESLMSELNILKEKNLCEDNLTETLENDIISVVTKQASVDIQEQLKTYSEWEKQRELVLNKQSEELNRLARIEHINKLKKDLADRELYLTFFDKEEEINLEMERLSSEDRKEKQYIHKFPHLRKKLKKLKETSKYESAS